MRVTVAFDCDGTLIHQVGERENAPKYENIDLFRQLERLGCTMYIWSGGGVSYAAAVADKLGLKAEIVAKGSFRPDIAVDDMNVTFGKVNLRVNGGE